MDELESFDSPDNNNEEMLFGHRQLATDHDRTRDDQG
jgi:hypothetical protein